MSRRHIRISADASSDDVVIDVAPGCRDARGCVGGIQHRNREGQRLLDRSLLNVVFVLMLASSIPGPVLTERLTLRMLETERAKKTGPAGARS